MKALAIKKLGQTDERGSVPKGNGRVLSNSQSEDADVPDRIVV